MKYIWCCWAFFFWDIVLHHWVIGAQCFRIEQWFQNTGDHSPSDAVQYPRRTEISMALLWKLKNFMLVVSRNLKIRSISIRDVTTTLLIAWIHHNPWLIIILAHLDLSVLCRSSEEDIGHMNASATNENVTFREKRDYSHLGFTYLGDRSPVETTTEL